MDTQFNTRVNTQDMLDLASRHLDRWSDILNQMTYTLEPKEKKFLRSLALSVTTVALLYFQAARPFHYGCGILLAGLGKYSNLEFFSPIVFREWTSQTALKAVITLLITPFLPIPLSHLTVGYVMGWAVSGTLEQIVDHHKRNSSSVH